MEYRIINEYPKVICKKEIPIGYIWFYIKDGILYLDMIEVIEKEMGYGTEIITYLFTEFDIDSIKGEILDESGDRAYWFWSSLGSELSVTPEDLRENNKVFFNLSRF